MRESYSVKNAKPIANCTDKELQAVYGYAKNHAVRMKRPEMGDDFGSFLMEDLVKQGTLRYNLHWRWAEFLKLNVGNLGHKKGRAKAKARLRPVAIEKLSDDGSTRYSVPVSDKPLPDTSDTVEYLANRFKGPERIALVLYVQWGFKYVEIAHAMGVTVQRVQQILHDAFLTAKIRGFVVKPKGSK